MSSILNSIKGGFVGKHKQHNRVPTEREAVALLGIQQLLVTVRLIAGRSALLLYHENIEHDNIFNTFHVYSLSSSKNTNHY